MRSFAPQMFLAICTLAAAGASQVIFVDQDALGANDGSSWQDAYVDLGDGLAAAAPGSQVWAAEGLYLPPPANMVDPRSASFVLASGVELYGGFDGSEASVNARDIAAHPTVLSGDLGTPGDASDNAYHVLRAELGAQHVVGVVARVARRAEVAAQDRGVRRDVARVHAGLTAVEAAVELHA